MWQRLSPHRVLYLNSYFFQQIYVRLRAVLTASEDQGTVRGDAYFDPGTLDAHVEDLARFAAHARRAGASVIVAPFDQSVATHPAGRKRYEVFLDAARSGGIPLCSMLHAFDGHELATLRLNRLDGHPSILANRLAVEHVGPCVRQEIAAPRP